MSLEINLKADDEPAELFIFDEIGAGWYGGITDKDVAEAMGEARGRDLDVHINSPGGDVFQGIAIANIIARHDGYVRTFNDGLVASAATMPFVMGDEAIMPSNTTLMIHDPWMISIVNEAAIPGISDLLKLVKGQIVDTYLGKSSESADKLSELMTAETWLTADAAKELGLVDSVTQSGRAAARASLARFEGAFRNIPAAMLSASLALRNALPEKDRKQSFNDYAASCRLQIADFRSKDVQMLNRRHRRDLQKQNEPAPTFENNLRRQINSLKTGRPQ